MLYKKRKLKGVKNVLFTVLFIYYSFYFEQVRKIACSLIPCGCSNYKHVKTG